MLFLAAWLTLAPLQIPRQEVAVAAAAGRIYVFGGISDGDVLDSVEEYDPVANRWRFVAPLPEPLHHAAAAAVGDSIYVIGGYRTLAFDPTERVYRYDVLTDSWTAVASLPAPRGVLAAAAIDGKVYAVGGIPFPSELTVYDPAADRWTRLAPMPTQREHLAAAAAGGRLFAISGRLGANRAALESYDPLTNAWTTLAPIPTARSGIAAAVAGDRIYVFGGEGNPAAPTGVFPQVESYDVLTGSWRAEPSMPTPRHGIGAAAIGGTIYVPAGAPVQGFGVSSANEALVIDAPPRRRAASRP